MPRPLLTPALLLAALLFILTGCSDWSESLSASSSEYTVRFKTTPWPPQVGSDAPAAIRINDRSNRTVRACHVTFRQYMPEHEMSTDDIVVQMEELRSGVYSGKSPEYSMGGDWHVEVTFDCGTGIQQANFDFSLAWPE